MWRLCVRKTLLVLALAEAMSIQPALADRAEDVRHCISMVQAKIERLPRMWQNRYGLRFDEASIQRECEQDVRFYETIPDPPKE